MLIHGFISQLSVFASAETLLADMVGRGKKESDAKKGNKRVPADVLAQHGFVAVRH